MENQQIENYFVPYNTICLMTATVSLYCNLRGFLSEFYGEDDESRKIKTRKLQTLYGIFNDALGKTINLKDKDSVVVYFVILINCITETREQFQESMVKALELCEEQSTQDYLHVSSIFKTLNKCIDVFESIVKRDLKVFSSGFGEIEGKKGILFIFGNTGLDLNFANP